MRITKNLQSGQSQLVAMVMSFILRQTKPVLRVNRKKSHHSPKYFTMAVATAQMENYTQNMNHLNKENQATDLERRTGMVKAVTLISLASSTVKAILQGSNLRIYQQE